MMYQKKLPSSSSPGSGFVALGQRNSLVGVKIKETATSSAIYRAVVCFIFRARARAMQNMEKK